MLGNGTVAELVLLDRLPTVRIVCPKGIIPAPGQYLMAYAEGSDAPLATILFRARAMAAPGQPDIGSFVAAPPTPAHWLPGTCLRMRGPLGHGFMLPTTARRIGLVSFDAPDTPASSSARRLLALLEQALRQDASVTLVCERSPEDLPLQVEVQPLQALPDVSNWADYIAIDSPRESLAELKNKLAMSSGSARAHTQVLVSTPMPCGGLGDCGVCSVERPGGTKLACVDGPVFDFNQLT